MQVSFKTRSLIQCSRVSFFDHGHLLGVGLRRQRGQLLDDEEVEVHAADFLPGDEVVDERVEIRQQARFAAGVDSSPRNNSGAELTTATQGRKEAIIVRSFVALVMSL